ncbi:MAG: ABC transporter permease, partial [Saprospiraceae bacterium]|nr:ABC transporter permease [Saprospiraceae bacterium]
ASTYFQLETRLKNIEEAENLFQKGRVRLVIVFPPDLQAAFYRGTGPKIQLLADATDPNVATTLINYARAIIMRYVSEQNPVAVSPLVIDTRTHMMYNPMLEGVYMFVPGVMTVILMLVSAMMTSIAITREKEMGTMEVLLASPIRPFLIILGKVSPYILIAMINTAVILLLGTFVFGMPVRGDIWLLIGECILFVITALSLGIFISTRAQTQQVAMMMSMVGLMLPTVILSGFIFPIESMPEILQWLSHIIPAKWFIIILKNIMLKGVGLEFVWKETLALGAMTLIFVLISIKNLKIRLE